MFRLIATLLIKLYRFRVEGSFPELPSCVIGISLPSSRKLWSWMTTRRRPGLPGFGNRAKFGMYARRLHSPAIYGAPWT
jgi:hypothetical protein